MGRIAGKPKKYSCFTPQEQECYEKMNERQRRYIDFRGQGYSKTQSYKMAGYDGKVSGQAAWILENKNKAMQDLIEKLLSNKRARELTKEESNINRQIDALAEQQGVEKVLETIEGADGETAKQIQFYRDIVNGKIKTVRVTKKFNVEGVLVERKVEEVSDIDAKMKARKELDRILGLNTLPDLSAIKIDDITINIVDASKKEELQDSRNSVNINLDEVEIVDGEQVVIIDEKKENAPPQQEQSSSDKFFAKVGGENG